MGEKDRLQSHARFGGDQVCDPKVFVQGDSRHISKLISASNARTIKQPKWFGLLLGLEGCVHHLILKNG